MLDVRRAERVIDASNVVTQVECVLPILKVKSGRPSELPVRALFVALLMLGGEGRLHLVRVAPLLNSLPKADRVRLGVDRPSGVTRRQVGRLVDLLSSALSAQGHAGLDSFCDALLGATVPQECSNSVSLAVDGTDLPSWARPPARNRAGRRRRPAVSSDIDARWRSEKKDTPWRRPFFGFDLTVAATVAERNGPSVPLVAASMRLRPATHQPVATALSAVRAAALSQGRLGDVLIDREYSRRNDGADFLLPVRALGGEPIFDLMPNQFGSGVPQHGALVVDGQPFCPALPRKFYRIVKPSVTADRAAFDTYLQAVHDRSRYALVPHGRRRADGSQVFQCPAAAGRLKCGLVSSSLKLPVTVMPALNAPKVAATGSVCSRKFTTFSALELPLSQRELFGTQEWHDSWWRRQRVEGFFGVLKNDACSNLVRGTIRVFGLYKVGLLAAFAVAATNLRLVATFRAGLKTAPVRRRGRPRKDALAVFRPAGVILGDSGAPPGP